MSALKASRSPSFALKWGDIDFSQGAMNVTRSIAYGIVGRCKTEASQKPVPVHSILSEALTQWRDRYRYREPDDGYSPTSIIADAIHIRDRPFSVASFGPWRNELGSRNGSAGTPTQ